MEGQRSIPAIENANSINGQYNLNMLNSVKQVFYLGFIWCSVLYIILEVLSKLISRIYPIDKNSIVDVMSQETVHLINSAKPIYISS
jgi:hypothetical protein